MKRTIVVTVLIILALCLVGCVPQSYYDYQRLHQPNEEYVAELSSYIRTDTERMADMNGDSYCKKCDKAIAGKVRICTYCGQYL
jgi:hypothetical protein